MFVPLLCESQRYDNLGGKIPVRSASISNACSNICFFIAFHYARRRSAGESFKDDGRYRVIFSSSGNDA
jgi:hypothetical protein